MEEVYKVADPTALRADALVVENCCVRTLFVLDNYRPEKRLTWPPGNLRLPPFVWFLVYLLLCQTFPSQRRINSSADGLGVGDTYGRLVQGRVLCALALCFGGTSKFRR